jgi:hypothetical protein
VRLSGDEEAALPGLLLLPRQEGVPDLLFLFFSTYKPSDKYDQFSAFITFGGYTVVTGIEPVFF